MKFSIPFAAIPFALLSFAPVATQAAMVQFQYQSIVSEAIPAANIAAGDDLFITITLDNGGGLENGVWSTNDVQTVTYQVGSGSGVYSYTFDVKGTDFSWNYTTGGFTTNAGGIITEAPDYWGGIQAAAIFHNSGDPVVFFNLDDGVLLRDANLFRNIEADAWRVVAVPEPSAALLGGLGALVMLRRCRR